MLETVAIMGPARFGVPLTQAVSAPLLGAMEGRGRGPAAQFAVAAAIRLLSNAVGIAFFVFVITGGLDAYSGTYENLAGRVGISLDETGTLVLTALGLVVWGVLASAVQVTVYRRGLRGWPAVGGRGRAAARGATPRTRAASTRARPRWPPPWPSRSCWLGTSWPLLAGVALVAGRGHRDGAGRPARVAHRAWSWPASWAWAPWCSRWSAAWAPRWPRAAGCARCCWCWWPPGCARPRAPTACARCSGARSGRLRRLPAVPEAIRALDHIGSEGHLIRAGRSLGKLAAETPFTVIAAGRRRAGLGLRPGGPLPRRAAARSRRGCALRARASTSALVLRGRWSPRRQAAVPL